MPQFVPLNQGSVVNYEDAYYQHQEGSLDDVAFESWKRTPLAGLGSASRRGAWRRIGDSFGSDFEAFINQLIAEAPVAPQPLARTERWKDDLAAELAKAP